MSDTWNPSDLCESCRAVPVAVEVPGEAEERPYRVCRGCERRLRAYALRPLEWFNLAAIHGPWRFLLHDDFYDPSEDHYGMASQPDSVLEKPRRFPAPTLAQIKGNLERLTDYAMTIHFLDGLHGEKVIEALSAVCSAADQKQALLSSLQRRVDQSISSSGWPNPAIESSAHTLCARCLGPLAADWIRQQWNAQPFRSIAFVSLAEATAACLPFEEGWKYVTDRLRVQSDSHAVSALISFRSVRTLDWMEENKIGAATDAWGLGAALSHFTWNRANSWLESGRPLSHVALAAIQACQRHNTILSGRLKPILEEPAPVDVMIASLNEYAERDKVPNVRKRVASIVAALEQNG